MKVIVIGGGKVGFYLSKTLVEHNHQPIIIEVDKELCARLADQLDTPIINGDGTTIEVLEEAQIGQCDAVVSVTGRDEDNLIACQLAKKRFLVPKTVARVNNPKNTEVMKELGVDIPINSTDNIARLLEREIDTASLRQLIELNRGKVTISELELPANFFKSGRTLQEFNLPENMVVASIFRNGEVIVPRGNTPLLALDKLVIVAENRAVHEINRVFRLNKLRSR